MNCGLMDQIVILIHFLAEDFLGVSTHRLVFL